ncbi:MAG TPA: hypothetical protein VGY56_21485 [Verrucomicrobiae bacterium]|nr:hypothetical protein [Verrucomicrobiae bacterium]
MDAIATYSERRIDGRRQFSIYPHEIVIVGRARFGAHFEVRLPLKTIDSTVSRLFIRSTLFLAGMCMAVGCAFICIILASLSPAVSWSYWLVWVIIAFGIVGFVLAGLSFKKIEFAQFRSQAGVRVLDIARSGPEHHKFDEFVQTLIQQIQAAKTATTGSGVLNA